MFKPLEAINCGQTYGFEVDTRESFRVGSFTEGVLIPLELCAVRGQNEKIFVLQCSLAGK